MVDGDLAFMTRMGITDQSRTALAHASDAVRALSMDMLASGHTPIFEFTSPENRIVLAYDLPELTLLAVRHTRTGRYMPHDELRALADRHEIPAVGAVGRVDNVHDFWKQARALEDLEGYVVAFENGHRLKTKADAYVLRHKALSGLAHEKNLLAWVAQNALDDVLPLLSPQAAASVQAYQDSVMVGVARHERDVQAFVEAHGHLDRKDFAARVKAEVDRALQPVVFRALDGHPPMRGLMDLLDKASGSETRIDAIRPLFGMAWEPPEASAETTGPGRIGPALRTRSTCMPHRNIISRAQLETKESCPPMSFRLQPAPPCPSEPLPAFRPRLATRDLRKDGGQRSGCDQPRSGRRGRPGRQARGTDKHHCSHP